jgi:hypothetical protein
MSRLFTREEADELLPHIAPLLWQVRELKREHDAAAAELEALQAQAKGNGHGIDVEIARARTAQQRAAVEINGTIERVKALGVEVKDLEMGLVDFRSQKDGRVVYLCWKLGEERVEWWHELDSGYAARERLE